jgi:hypothetical protein
MKRMWPSIGLLLVVLLVAVGAAVVPASPSGANVRAPSFLGMLAPGGDPFSGVVVEEVPAGGYTYRRIRRDDDELDWVVAISTAELLGERVTVRPFGVATDFQSARTGRVFASLTFAIVRPKEKS